MQRSTTLFARSGTRAQERMMRPLRDPMPDGKSIMSTPKPTTQRSRARIFLDVVLGLIGFALLIGGVRLVRLGGSWDYVIAGAAILSAGILIVRGRISVMGLFPHR
jgi:hypothetical protein